MESKIFTKAELEEIEQWNKGDKSDKTGILSSRVRPKIIEIDYWRKNWSKLKKLIKVKDDKN